MHLKGYSLLLLVAAFVALPASAQERQIERATAAPDVQDDRASTVSPVFVRGQVDEGLVYGHHNKPGGETSPPNRDVFGYFDPTDPFTVSEVEPYPVSAFAGTMAGDDRFYFMLQPEGALSDTLGWYDFDTQTLGPNRAITVYDPAGEVMDVADIPQWVDASIDTETGNMILLGRAGACGALEGGGGALWSLDLTSLEATFMLQFTDPNNCPLSGTYDNENNRYVGMVPDAGVEGFYQADLTTGATVGMLPLPDDLHEGSIAQFIQSAATNYYENDDPSDNEMWFFLFEGIASYVGTSRQILFDEDGIISGQISYGFIDETASYVEALTSGFPNNAPAPGVSAEEGAMPQTFELVGVYPNPFQSTATVMLRADEPVENVSVKVYDVLGREVAVLHDGPLSASTHHIGLEGSNLPAGVYLVSVRSGEFAQTRKVVLID